MYTRLLCFGLTNMNIEINYFHLSECVCDVLYAVLYVCVSCFVVRGCAVSRRYVNVYNCDMFSVVNVYLDHLRFCLVCIDGRRYVCCSKCNECIEPTSCLVQPIDTHGGEVMYFNCDDICMCVVNKLFELLEFVFDVIYVDLPYDEISLTFTAGSVSLCSVCSHVVVFRLSVRLSWYPMWMRWLL